MTNESEVVYASEILAKIEKGEDIDLNGRSISGNLDLKQLNLKNLKKDEQGRTVISSKISLANCRLMGEFSFTHSNFKKPISFFRTHFEGNADFSGNFGGIDFFNTHFRGDATFFDARFGGEVKFEGVHFERYAAFSDTHFVGAVYFKFANFGGMANFSNAHFEKIAVFNSTHFQEDANFDGVHFEKDAGFSRSRFEENAGFDSAHFQGNANFEGARFAGGIINFSNAHFQGNASFGSVQFAGFAGFSSAYFERESTFSKAHFLGNAHFQVVHFKLVANFLDAHFQEDANFNGAHFYEDADFRGAQIFKIIQFTAEGGNLATFDRLLKLDNSKIYSMYIDAEFHDISHRQISLQYPDLTHLFRHWESLKDHIRYDNQEDESAYLAIIKSYNNLGWSNDADQCNYYYRTIRRKEHLRGIPWVIDFIPLLFYGYGVRVLNPLFCMIFVLGLSAAFYWLGGQAQFPGVIGLSTIILTTTTQVNNSTGYPLSGLCWDISILERILGWLFMSTFLVALAKKTLR